MRACVLHTRLCFSGALAADPVSPLPSPSAGRVLLSSVFDNPTFKWAMISLGAAIAAILAVLAGYLAYTKCGRGKSAPVAPAQVRSPPRPDHTALACTCLARGVHAPHAACMALAATRTGDAACDPCGRRCLVQMRLLVSTCCSCRSVRRIRPASCAPSHAAPSCRATHTQGDAAKATAQKGDVEKGAATPPPNAWAAGVAANADKAGVGPAMAAAPVVQGIGEPEGMCVGWELHG